MLRATNELAREHGVTPLLVVLQFGHEELKSSPNRRRRILDNASIPYVFVDTDSSWRLGWDRHPNARAALAIATAIVTALRERLIVADRVQAGHPIVPSPRRGLVSVNKKSLR